ncbi:MAG TPA: DHA2 family efflux MFS transporter permease subunit [Aliidongia sp.]|nr:DHA2 family efflux MFS transporter permease subunit [Aliidongia sp.]
MTAAVAAGARPDSHRAVTAVILLATFMQAANISLPNAALLHIQGALSMADDEVGWVFSAYIAASAITMPMTRWLAGRYGRKLLYQLAIAVFALGLVLATRAGTPMQFITARIIQGAASGPLAPLSLAIALDLLPPARHGRISLIWTVALILGIVSGPSIGGWLAEYHGWRSIFYLSVPIAGFIFLVTALSLPEKKAEQNPPFDIFGVATFTLGMIGLQMALDRGERLEWLASPEIWAEAVASVLGFYLFIVHVLTTQTHFLNKSLLKDRNFVLSTVMFFALGFVLLPTMALTSPMLDELLNYPADTTGYVAIPRSIALLAALILVSYVPARVDNRLLVAGGTALVVYANWRMLGYSPAMDWRPVITAGVLQGAGLGILMPVLAKTAFSTLDPKLRPEGTVLFNLSRLYGSTIGIAVVQTFFYGNTQAMHLALAENITPYRAAAHAATALSRQGLAQLNEMITGQAAVVAVIGQFKILMIAMLVVSPLVLLLRKPRPID